MGATSSASRKCCGRRFSILFGERAMSWFEPITKRFLAGRYRRKSVPFETMSKALLRTRGYRPMMRISAGVRGGDKEAFLGGRVRGNARPVRDNAEGFVGHGGVRAEDGNFGGLGERDEA